MNAWVQVRTLSSVAAEGTSAPADGSCVPLLVEAPRVEIRLRSGSVANSPTSVTFNVWRTSGGATDKIGSFTIAASDIATPVVQIFELYDTNVYVTVASFAGGAAPTVTGTIEARAVFGG